MTQEDDIRTLVEPYLAAEQLELDDLELTGHGRGRVLRVTVDGQGVTIDRLADVSRGVSRLLDEHSDLEGRYQLEVTSPGLERKLKRPGHFVKAVGREVLAKVNDGDSRATLRGRITYAGDSSFTVEGEHGVQVVPYEDVVTARTVFTWEKQPKPGH